jgi:flagellin-like protein
MRSRRSISDIVAVVLLIVIAIAAAVIIYMWLSGLIGSVHTSTSATQVKLEITGASVTETTSSGTTTYIVNVTVYNPPDSPSTSITVGELEFTNGTMLCSTGTVTYTLSSGTTTTTTTITPGGSVPLSFTCKVSATAPAGTPVEVVLITSQGVQVSYTTSVS